MILAPARGRSPSAVVPLPGVIAFISSMRFLNRRRLSRSYRSGVSFRNLACTRRGPGRQRRRTLAWWSDRCDQRGKGRNFQHMPGVHPSASAAAATTTH